MPGTHAGRRARESRQSRARDSRSRRGSRRPQALRRRAPASWRCAAPRCRRRLRGDGQGRVEAVSCSTDPMLIANARDRSRILPRSTGCRRSASAEFADAGGLMAYGVELPGSLAPRRRLRRQDPEGRQAWRPADRAADEVRAGHQPQDRQGPRPDDPAVAPAAGGSGDRVDGPARVPRWSLLASSPRRSPPRRSRRGRCTGSGSSDGPATAAARASTAFRQGLRELGYVEGQNIVIEYRLAGGQARPASRPGGRAGPSEGGRDRRVGQHRRPWRPRGHQRRSLSSCRGRRRSGGRGARREPRPARRERHGAGSSLPRN